MMQPLDQVLDEAFRIYQMEEPGPELMIVLARKGIFTRDELADICQIPAYRVQRLVDKQQIRLPKKVPPQQFDPGDLDILSAIAYHYNRTGDVAQGLVQMASQMNATKVIARMTGVPYAKIVDALQ